MIKSRQIFISFFILLLAVSMLFAQSSRIAGKIAGFVTDDQSGDPLAGVNIVLQGTSLGAATDIDGGYTILNVPAKRYEITFSYIGYTSKKYTEVEIVPDYTTKLNVKLGQDLIESEIIVVTAERPVIQRDVTSTVKEVSATEIRHSPVTNFTQIVAQQIGAIETGRGRRSGGIHIRGGRNNEIVFYVDGVNSNDPFLGAAGITVDNNAIEQLNIISGGFNAEYGESMSGVVQIITKSGSPETYGFEAEVTSDAPLGGTDYDWNYNKYFSSLTGPIPGLKKLKSSFYLTGGYFDTGDRNPAIFRQGHNDRQRADGSIKLSLEPIPSILRMQLNARFTDTKEHLYSHARSANPYWLNQGFGRDLGDNRFSFTLSHMLSDKTWYDVTLVRFENFNKYSAQDHTGFNEWKALSTKLDWVDDAEERGWYNRLTGEFSGISEEEAWYYYYSKVANGGNGFVQQNENGEWEWNSIQAERNALNDREHDTGEWIIDNNGELFFREFNLENYSTYLSDPDNPAYADYDYRGDIDAFAYPYPRDPLGNYIMNFTPRWHDHNTSYLQGEFSFTSQVDKNNLMKFGGWGRSYTLDYTDIQFLNTKPYFDTYEINPLEMAFYFQDKLEFEDMTINAGLRYDYWDSDSDHPQSLYDLDQPRVKTKAKEQFSPRFGISFAVSSQSKMYAHYGKFFQRPDLSDMFMNMNADITNGLPLIGNPNLPPEKTTAYEIGFERALTNDISFKANAFYKDVENLLSTDSVNTIFNNTVASYTIYLVNDFSKIKGLEFELKKRLSTGLSGSLTYSFLDAKGSGSEARDFYYLFLNTDSELPRKEYPLDFDITHDIKGKMNFYTGRGKGPQIWGIKPLSDTNLNVFLTWSTGAAYTPTDFKGNPLERGAGRLPGQNRIDLRLDRYFHPMEGLEVDLFFDIRNVFDMRNVVEVYTLTDKPDDNGRAPVWDAQNTGAYSDFELYGYDDEYDMYLADLAGWKSYVKDPSHYGIPRIIRAGIMLKF